MELQGQPKAVFTETATTTLLATLLAASVDVIIIEGDALDLTNQVPSEIIQLTVTDPPYESINRHRAIGTTTRLKGKWFETVSNDYLSVMLNALHRVQDKHSHLYVFCDSETEHVLLTGTNPYVPTAKTFRPSPLTLSGFTAWPTLNWIKVKNEIDEVDDLTDDAVRIGMGYHWRRSSERIIFLEKGKRPLHRKEWSDTLIGMPAVKKTDFPTRKPANVLRRLILNSSDEGGLVFDPFAGSGAVGKVAVNLDRRALLFDTHLSESILHGWPSNKRVMIIHKSNQVTVLGPEMDTHFSKSSLDMYIKNELVETAVTSLNDVSDTENRYPDTEDIYSTTEDIYSTTEDEDTYTPSTDELIVEATYCTNNINNTENSSLQEQATGTFGLPPINTVKAASVDKLQPTRRRKKV